MRVPELLAPAGGPDAGYAALRHGADAVYLGLRDFSARADAENFTPAELSGLAAFARGLSPPRRVYAAVNTLVRSGEFSRALATVADAAQSGADAVIVQDLGLARQVARHFPELALHASTQMALHSAEGVRQAARWGFRRVTLAREMTLGEIALAGEAARACGAEIEVFVHGALCYGYSGLCLAGGLLRGRSGNRGQCAYPCREYCQTSGRDPCRSGYGFSLRDMARPDGLAALRDAGVASVKIEGRKKSALYVAAAVRLYRGLLDARGAAALPEASREIREAADDVRSVFSRPWTPFFLDGGRPGGLADPEITGHRGAPCGTVAEVRAARGGERGLRPPASRGAPRGLVFETGLPLERHDGLQIDLPGDGHPRGFAVLDLRLARADRDERVFGAPAGAAVWVALPPDGAAIEPGMPVYRASSQAVKRRYAPPPRPSGLLNRFKIDIEVVFNRQEVRFSATIHAAPGAGPPAPPPAPPPLLRVERLFPPATDRAQSAGSTSEAGQKAFGRLGQTRFLLDRWRCHDPDCLFWPPSAWNHARREVMSAAEEALAAYWAARAETAAAGFSPGGAAAPPRPADPGPSPGWRPRWSIFVDHARWLAGFGAGDWLGVEEVVVSLAPKGAAPADGEAFEGEMDGLRRRLASAGTPAIPVRVALPAVLRGHRREAVRGLFESLRRNGQTRWMVAGAWALDWFAGDGGGADLAADWPLYSSNHAAVQLLRDAGFTRCTLSPEENGQGWDWVAALPCAVPPWAIVHQDAPLFLSAVCVHHVLARAKPARCPFGPGGREAGSVGQGGAAGSCRAPPLPIRLAGGGDVLAIPLACGTAALPACPLSLADRFGELRRAGIDRWRADFLWRGYGAAGVRGRWRALREAWRG